MTQSLPPFSCVHTPEFPDLLASLGCSLVISTYQAGKVIILSATEGDTLVQLPRTFAKPMGMAASGQRLAIATRDTVVVLANAPQLAPAYPRQPGLYDALFVPRAVYFSGELNLHDLAWGAEGLWAVNTRFSCLCLIDDQWSFTPRWAPPFISALTPDDRCHLNGLALVDGRPRYVTALGATDSAAGWRTDRLGSGVLLEVPGGEPILRGLTMPHSPRMYDDQLYLLLSATGELVRVDTARGSYDVVNRLPGFVRGLARYGDYLFVGASHLRQRHIFGDLPIAQQEPFSGVLAVHLPSGRLAGSIKYLTSCEEIYDVLVLPGLRRPGLLAPGMPFAHASLATPNAGYWTAPPDDSERKT